MNGDDDKKNQFQPWVIAALVAFVLTLFYIFSIQKPAPAVNVYDIPYSRFKSFIEKGQVEKVELLGQVVQGELFEPAPIGPKGQVGKSFTSYIPSFGGEQLLALLEQQNVAVTVKPPSHESTLMSAFIATLPWLLFLGIWIWLMRRAYRNMGGGIGSMKESTATIEENVCFENYYAGIGHDNASPLVINNTCYENIRAGIGAASICTSRDRL